MKLTTEQREELEQCDECMTAHCIIYGHPPCPCCTDDCDDADCLEPVPNSIYATKTHTCIFPRCAKHKQFEVRVIDVQTAQQERLDAMWNVLGDCFKRRLT